MAPTTRPPQAKYSEQNVLNNSYDQDFDVLAFELLAYDSATDVMKRVTLDAMSHYGTNDVDKASSTVLYEGLETADGGWQVVKTETIADVTSNRFATIKNNDTVTTYGDAWTGRAALTFGTYSQAF